jgi:hypothetical protein
VGDAEQNWFFSTVKLEDEVRMSGYDVAQICRNGHLINGMVKRSPGHNAKFCSKCGAEAMTVCKDCKAAIRGYYFSDTGVVVGGTPMNVPAYCHACGRPYPWTRAALKAARELVAESMKLTEDEKALLTKSLHEIVAETPTTPAAAERVKRLIKKAGPGIGAALSKIVTTVASDAARKILSG